MNADPDGIDSEKSGSLTTRLRTSNSADASSDEPVEPGHHGEPLDAGNAPRSVDVAHRLHVGAPRRHAPLDVALGEDLEQDADARTGGAMGR